MYQSLHAKYTLNSCQILMKLEFSRQIFQKNTQISGDRGSTVVKVLRYKSEGRWFDPSLRHWNFSLTENPSDRTMVLWSAQPLTEMSTRSISWR